MSGSSNWGSEMGPERPEEGGELSHIAEVAQDFLAQEQHRRTEDAARETARAIREASFFTQGKDAALAVQAQEYLLEAERILSLQKAALAEQGLTREEIEKLVGSARAAEKPTSELTLTEIEEEINATRERHKKLVAEEIANLGESSNPEVQRLIRRLIYLEDLAEQERG